MRLTLLLRLAVAAAASPIRCPRNIPYINGPFPTDRMVHICETMLKRPSSQHVLSEVEAWRELAAEGLPNVAGMPVPVTSWRHLLVTLRHMQSTGALDEDEEDCVLAAIVHILNNDPNEEPLISRVDGVLRRFTEWMDEDRFQTLQQY